MRIINGNELKEAIEKTSFSRLEMCMDNGKAEFVEINEETANKLISMCKSLIDNEMKDSAFPFLNADELINKLKAKERTNAEKLDLFNDDTEESIEALALSIVIQCVMQLIDNGAEILHEEDTEKDKF